MEFAGCNDVVFTSGVGGIDTEWITSRIADEAILGLTETPVWSRLTEIPRELVGVDLDNLLA